MAKQILEIRAILDNDNAEVERERIKAKYESLTNNEYHVIVFLRRLDEVTHEDIRNHPILKVL